MTRALALLAAVSAVAPGTPAFAQDHSMHNMPSMGQPMQDNPARKAVKPRTTPARSQPASKAASRKVRAPQAPPPEAMPGMDHSQHRPGRMPSKPDRDKPQSPSDAMPDMPGREHPQLQGAAMPDMPGMDHEQRGQSAMPAMEMTGTALPAGNAPPPPVPHDHFADRDFPGAEMARAREAMMKENGDSRFAQAILNIFEYQAHNGRDGYRWDGEAFWGGDINRLWLKSEGEGEFKRGIDTAEVQALYSQAVDPYFNLQAGVRQDFGRGPDRTYATVGFEGLAPGMFEVEGALFLSNKGDVLGRLEGYYDQRITQRLIFQPRVELNLAAQDVPENDVGSGLVDVELGARLRYEFSRQFAPYVGISYLRKTGETARLSRLAGEDVHATSLVAGVRFWF
ncbi:copper resistance protein B [Sphingobium sp. H39-3-25]|uniref:copper resistance protein B n=1 Tax=Sphingobium arseniciresistens TaxID=3030834 RepID=UPI0023B8F383|nr:copper resistance protein B [Sphingobium arseniciresistens]